MEALYKRIPKSMLPQEYLPDDYTGPNAGTFDELAGKAVFDEVKLNTSV